MRNQQVMCALKRALWSLAVLIVVGIPTPASGCGDKLVMLGRGVRFDELYTSRSPGSVVLYTEPGSRLEKADRKLHIGASLFLAGHEVAVVRTSEELKTAANDTAVDVLLVDAKDVSAIDAVNGGPEVLGILYRPSKEERVEAGSSNACLTEAAPKKGKALLELIDALVESHSTGVTPECASR